MRSLPFCFFFSSRSRHTRCSRDWSSDVCSSDLARAFAAEGAGVVVADLAETADATAAEIRRSGGRAVAVRGDVSRSADMRVLAERSLREFGGLDVLVTCAGLGLSGLLLDQDEEEWTRAI